MSINDINLNKRQINFLAAYEAKHGQPATVTRKDLLAFKDSIQPNEKGLSEGTYGARVMLHSSLGLGNQSKGFRKPMSVSIH